MKEAYYFPHDANARTDAKILELRAELGWEGYGLWWALVEQLREASEYRLSNDRTGGLAMGMGIQKKQLESLLALCFDVGLLDLEDGYFFSPSLRRRMVALDNKRLARAESARNAAEKRWQKPADAAPMRTHSASTADAMPIDATLDLTREDLTRPNLTQPEETASAESESETSAEELPSESPTVAAQTEGGAADVATSLTAAPGGRWAYDPTSIAEGLILPFDTPDFRTAWVAYRTFREEDHQRQLTGGMQEQEMLRKIGLLAAGDQEKAIAIIAQTIAKGWKDLYKLDEQRPNNRPNPGQPERGAKPTAAASTGARAVSAQLRAIREERAAQNGSYVDTGAAAGTHAGLGSPVPPGIGAPQGGRG